MPVGIGLDVTARNGIGERLRMMRQARELTQKGAGHELGVSQSAVAQWETGVTLPTVSTQHALAELYRTTRRFLFAEVVAIEERAA